MRHVAGRPVRGWSAFLTVIAMILALVGPSPVSANVIATTGQLIKISPPADVLQSGFCSPDKVFTFDEQQGVTLGADVRVDYKTPGSYTAYAGNPIPTCRAAPSWTATSSTATLPVAEETRTARAPGRSRRTSSASSWPVPASSGATISVRRRRCTRAVFRRASSTSGAERRPTSCKSSTRARSREAADSV